MTDKKECGRSETSPPQRNQYTSDDILQTVSSQSEEARSLLPEVKLEPAQLPQIVDRAEQILCSCKSGVYQRGGLLVTIGSIPATKTGERPLIYRKQETTVVKNIDHIFLAEKLTQLAVWERGKKPVDCPDKVAKTLMARASWKIPILTGIITAPTIRSDGSILDKEGYDEATGLFFKTNGVKFGIVPENPSKEDAEAALMLLEDLLKDFPFENKESRSVAVSAIITALARRAIPTAPMHCFSAPKMGSGKSLLADIAALIATGRENNVVPQSANEAEEAKRLLAILQDGEQLVCIDNIERPLGGAALCIVLTQQSYKDRVLGATRTATYPTDVFIMATGNNLTIVGDLSTRALMCKLDPKTERPEEREFSVEIKKYVLEHRGELVIAGLTILKAYLCAGSPKQKIKQYGRFEGWSDLIRSALIWVGLTDPCISRKEIENADPERNALGNVLEGLFAVFGRELFSTSNVISKVQDPRLEGTDKENADTLREALAEFCRDSRGNFNANSGALGKRFAACRQRIERGLRLDQAGTSHQAIMWQISNMDDVRQRSRQQEQPDFFLNIFDDAPGISPLAVAEEHRCEGTLPLKKAPEISQ